MSKEDLRKLLTSLGVCKPPKESLTEDERFANRNRILSILRGIENRAGIEDVIQFLDESLFFDIECHTHHRYSGGLAEHSLEVYDAATKICKDTSPDSIAIAALLHDLGDIQHGGGRKSVEILKGLNFQLTASEERAIKYHMMHRRSESEMEEFKKAMDEELWGAITGSDCFSAGGYKDGLKNIVKRVVEWARTISGK